MKRSLLSLSILLLTTPPAFANESLSLEARMEMLEKRLKAAEQRADKAEAEIAVLKGQPVTQHPVVVPTQQITKTQKTAISAKQLPPAIRVNKDVDLNFYGDVEFNIDGASRTGSLTSLKTSANKDWAPGKKERWDINGRILLGFDGIKRGDNGKFAGITAQPLADMNGKMNLDDAAFYFGQQDDWKIKVGRFEAWDMFPLNQDTFVEYSGNTANNLYSDGYGYIYMMKEARGRSNSGGNFLISKNIDNWYLELNTLVEDGSSLFVDRQYHGMELDNKKNVIYLRPVIAWKSGSYSVAGAMEKNIIRHAYGYQDQNGHWVDQSDRTGYGMTMSWNTLKDDPRDGVLINLNSAWLDAKDERDFSIGINGLWRNIELGYIYAHNKIDRFNMNNISNECDSDCALLAPGRYDIHTLHSSWKLPNIMDMPNFDIYLGAYVSWLDANSMQSGSDNQRYGSRIRFKYYF